MINVIGDEDVAPVNTPSLFNVIDKRLPVEPPLLLFTANEDGVDVIEVEFLESNA